MKKRLLAAAGAALAVAVSLPAHAFWGPWGGGWPWNSGWGGYPGYGWGGYPTYSAPAAPATPSAAPAAAEKP